MNFPRLAATRNWVTLAIVSATIERAVKLDELSRTVRPVGADAARPDDPEAGVPSVGRNALAKDVFIAAFAAGVGRLVRLDAQLRVEPDAERLHDARVTVRRLRSDLRTFRPLVHGPWSDNLRAQLRWLGHVLSEARDADVLLDDISDRAAQLPSRERATVVALLRPFQEQRMEAYARVGAALRSPQYLQLIDALIAAARTPQFRPAAYRRARTMLARLMRPVWRRLRKQVRRAGSAPHDHDLHRVRIKAKHARYAAEALAPVASRARRFAKCVTALQTLLGEQHDAVAAYGALRNLRETPEAAFLAGEIAAAEQADAIDRRGRWRACWRGVCRKERRFW